MLPILCDKMLSMARNYWLDLFTVETWEEFRFNGSSISGFSESSLKTVQQMKHGDYLLCYLTRASRWVGVLEVVGDAFVDRSVIWKSQTFPSRLPVRPVLEVDPEFGVAVLDLRDQLSVFQGLGNPNLWSGPFRRSPTKWKTADGEVVLRALTEAKDDPVRRPIGKPRKSSTTDVQVPVPLDEDVLLIPEDVRAVAVEGVPGPTEHTEIQYLLMKLGADMGFDVHVARNDPGREWQGQRLGAMRRRRELLPQQFDPDTNKTIKLIDLLWLQGNAIVAAFEIESTTSIYSGLLRMSDLLAMQPNIAIPLFLVAPEDRREKVIQQVNRPTFARMTRPLVDVCRYIPFETLREALSSAHPYIRYLKSDWLQTISESCARDEV